MLRPLQLRLSVRCDGSAAQVQQVLRLAAAARLVSLSFEHQLNDGAASSAVFELLSHSGFQQRVGQHLRQLLGAPGSTAGGRAMHHFAPAAFPQLQRLQLYTPPHQQVLSLRNPAWQALQQLRELDVIGRHYVAVRVLPPHLRRLSISAWHVLIEPAVLVCCPQVCQAGCTARLGGC